MEFIGKLKRKIILLDDKVSIETGGWAQKITGVASVKFSYDEIKSVEINDRSLLAMREGFIEFKVDGSHNSAYEKKDLFGNKKNMADNPYVVMFVQKQKDEVHKLRDEVLRRSDIKKSKIAGGSITSDSSADELKKYADLRDQGILTEEEFNHKKKEILGL